MWKGMEDSTPPQHVACSPVSQRSIKFVKAHHAQCFLYIILRGQHT